MTLNEAAYHLLRETGRKADDTIALAHAKFFIKYRRAYYVRQDMQKRQGYIFQQSVNVNLSEHYVNDFDKVEGVKETAMPMPLQMAYGAPFHYVGTLDGCQSFDWVPSKHVKLLLKYGAKAGAPKYTYIDGKLLVYNFKGEAVSVIGTFVDPLAIMNLQKGSENCFNDDREFFLPDNMFYYIIEEAKRTPNLLTKTVNTDGNTI